MRKLALGVFAVAVIAVGVATAGASEFTGASTLDVTLGGDASADFSYLGTGPGEPYTVRSDLAAPQPGRESRRTSLDYFGQLSDFQLADEESPARVEFFDEDLASSFSNSGHRPQETLLPQEIEASVDEMNQAAPASPVPQGDGSRAAMDQVLLTGDLADSNGRLEAGWVKTLLEGGQLDPGSGQDPALSGNPVCSALGTIDDTLHLGLFDNPANYTGVQDYNDYLEGDLFYDPNHPAGQFAGWPSFPGLVDKAQQPFPASGLSVPSYIAPGNHDVLVQGNLSANAAFEAVALGCIKPMGPFPAHLDAAAVQRILDPAYLTGLLTSDPEKVILVPPDNRREYLSKQQYGQVFGGPGSSNGHGFGFIDPAEAAASHGNTLYYSFSPKPGLRFISLDTNSSTAAALVDPVGGSDASNGNIDDPQFQWLKAQLDAAQANNELVITYSHHASSSMTFSLPDEGTFPCLANDAHGHDINPGCDVDPRSSSPIHLGGDFVNLLCQYPNVVAHVAGHSHENRVDPHQCQNHDGFWEIKSPAIADWPTQSRTLDLMDNHDGTLSLFGTMLNHEGAAQSVAPGTPAAGLSVDDMASLARTIAFNDFQAGGTSSAIGQPKDRNVELVLDDPRDNAASAGGGSASADDFLRGRSEGSCATARVGNSKANRLTGTRNGDRMRGLGGNDRLRGRGGDDCIAGGSGNDTIASGAGSDRIKGGGGEDAIGSRDGEVDKVDCGAGVDRALIDKVDVARGCESVVRR
jgi:hemolysin type calcium-binding protein